MSLLGAIGRTALKVFQSNRHVLKHSSQSTNIMSISLVNMFSQMSTDSAIQLPDRPKRIVSGYNLFFKESLARLRSENSGLKPKELFKIVAEEWKQLDPYIKQEMMEKAKKRSDEYKQEFDNWKKSLNENQMKIYLMSQKSRKRVLAKRRLKLELKRIEYPIRPKSAFNLYIKDKIENRPKTAEPFDQVFKSIVSKWSSLTPEERAPYVETAKSDKIRYLEEMSEWQLKLRNNNETETLDRITKLRALSSKSSLKSIPKKVRVRKVAKKKAKSKTTKSKTKAKPKLKSRKKSLKAKESSKKVTTKPKASKIKEQSEKDESEE